MTKKEMKQEMRIRKRFLRTIDFYIKLYAITKNLKYSNKIFILRSQYENYIAFHKN